MHLELAAEYEHRSSRYAVQVHGGEEPDGSGVIIKDISRQ
jgi:hypothetical protein